MVQFSYIRHFLVLACVSIFIAACARNAWLPGGAGVFALFGALHATALLAALRYPVPWSKKVLVLGLAAALSLLSYRLGLLVRSAAAMAPGHTATYLALGSAASLGAASYALVLRRVLGVTSNVAVVAVGCVLATCLGAFTVIRVPGPGVWWLVVLWWFAFSGGLWLSGSRPPRPAAA